MISERLIVISIKSTQHLKRYIKGTTLCICVHVEIKVTKNDPSTRVLPQYDLYEAKNNPLMGRKNLLSC